MIDSFIWWFGAIWLLVGGSVAAVAVLVLSLDRLIETIIERMHFRAAFFKALGAVLKERRERRK